MSNRQTLNDAQSALTACLEQNPTRLVKVLNRMDIASKITLATAAYRLYAWIQAGFAATNPQAEQQLVGYVQTANREISMVGEIAQVEIPSNPETN